MIINFPLIGKRVKEIRNQQQISQTKLAELADLSVPYISYIETAKKQVSLSALISIANALGVTVDELLNGNQLYNPTEYQTDIDLIMADCSPNEKRFIYELVDATLKSLRSNAWTLSENDTNEK